MDTLNEKGLHFKLSQSSKSILKKNNAFQCNVCLMCFGCSPNVIGPFGLILGSAVWSWGLIGEFGRNHRIGYLARAGLQCTEDDGDDDYEKEVIS